MIDDALEQKALQAWMVNNGVVFVNGHYVFTDGDHSAVYTDMANMLSRTWKAWDVARSVARMVEPHKFDTIVAPPHADYGWGLLLSLAIHQDYGREVTFAYAQETTELVEAIVAGSRREIKVVTDKLHFPRQQGKFVRGRRVIIVCDVLSKGSTARKMIEAVQQEGGLVAGIVAVCTHSDITRLDGHQVFSFLRIDADLHQPPCPPGWPDINIDLGHGKEYKARTSREGTVS